MSNTTYFPEFIELLTELKAEQAEFLIVGAYALAKHGVSRGTKDIDVWVRPSQDNARRVFRALARFGAPLRTFGVNEADFAEPGQTLQLGLPPRRIDVLTEISGVDFDTAWANRVSGNLGPLEVPFIGRDELLANKRASGRPKDLLDVGLLCDEYE